MEHIVFEVPVPQIQRGIAEMRLHVSREQGSTAQIILFRDTFMDVFLWCELHKFRHFLNWRQGYLHSASQLGLGCALAVRTASLPRFPP